MTEADIIFFTIKLTLGGIIAFLAILLWSKTRDFAWMNLVLAAVTAYSQIVLDLLIKLGIFSLYKIQIHKSEIPLIQLILTVLPSLFVIIAFILMLIKNKRR